MNLEDCLQVIEASDTGLVRTHNEDSTALDSRLGLVMVADGMGGYRGGEVASAIAVTTVYQHLRRLLPDLDQTEVDPQSGLRQESLLMRQAITQANESIFSLAQAHPEYRGMGTTAVSLLFYDNQVSVAHVGDSRAYRLRNGVIEVLTNDHTVRQELIDKGYYTAEEADRTVSRNLVTRAIGIDTLVEVDLQEEVVIPGDIFLLCSDGLNDMVADDEIENLLNSDAELESISRSLIDRANEMGGADNITVLLVKVLDGFPMTRSWSSRFADWFN